MLAHPRVGQIHRKSDGFDFFSEGLKRVLWNGWVGEAVWDSRLVGRYWNYDHPQITLTKEIVLPGDWI